MTIEQKELKQQFFAAYYGSKAVWKNVNLLPKDELVWDSKNLWQIDETDYLELKNVEDISTDEAIQVASLTNIDFPNGNAEAIEFGLELIKSCFIYYDDWLHSRDIIVTNDISVYTIISITDYLRKHGYALPFHGINVGQQVFRYFWVKLIS